MDDRLLLYWSKGQAKFAIILMFSLASLPFWFGFFNLGGLIWASIFATIGFIAICRQSKLSATEPVVIIDADGITDTRWPWKTLPWDDVEGIWLERGQNYQVVEIQLKDYQKYQSRMSLLGSIIAEVSEWLGSGHLTVGTMGTNVGSEEVWNFIYYLKAAGKISVPLDRVISKKEDKLARVERYSVDGSFWLMWIGVNILFLIIEVRGRGSSRSGPSLADILEGVVPAGEALVQRGEIASIIFVSLLPALFMGIGVGGLHSAILNRKVHKFNKWTRSTLAGWMIAIGLGVLGGAVGGPVAEMVDNNLGIVIGLSIGMMQWLVLRNYFNHSFLWILACVVGWGVGLSLLLSTDNFSARIWAGIISGTVTAACMVWLLNTQHKIISTQGD